MQLTAIATIATATFMPFYGEDDYQPERSVGYLVKRIHALSLGALEPMFAAADLTGMQWSALSFICIGRGETAAELARELGYDKGAMTRMLDVLERRGLIVRTRCGADRRVIRLALTAAGTRLAEDLRGQVLAQWNRWLEGWDADAVEALIAGLQRLRRDIEQAD